MADNAVCPGMWQFAPHDVRDATIWTVGDHRVGRGYCPTCGNVVEFREEPEQRRVTTPSECPPHG